MSDIVKELTVEFMEEFYSHVCAKTPSFMARPPAEAALAASLESLLVEALTAMASATTSEEITAGMPPLVANMTLIIQNYTVEGEERNTWLGHMDEFRNYVLEELSSGS